MGKLTKWPISLENFHFGYLKGARFKYRFYFCSLCVKRKFWANLDKNDRLIHESWKFAFFVLVSQIMVFHFAYKKDFWHILIKFIVFKVFLSSSRPNKKQFQLVDLVIRRLWYSYIAFRLADLSKRKPEIQTSHSYLQKTLRKDSNDSFHEVTRNF